MSDTRTHVDDDVDDGTAGAADQLGLRVGSHLEVHAAKGAGPVVERHVALGHQRFEAGGEKLVGVERAGEEAAGVRAKLEVDDGDAIDGCGRDDHRLLQKRSLSICWVSIRC